jgi:hypothetical protein
MVRGRVQRCLGRAEVLDSVAEAARANPGVNMSKHARHKVAERALATIGGCPKLRGRHEWRRAGGM